MFLALLNQRKCESRWLLCIVWTDERQSLITLDSCMTSAFKMSISQRNRTFFFLTYCELQACCACHRLEALCNGIGGGGGGGGVGEKQR